MGTENVTHLPQFVQCCSYARRAILFSIVSKLLMSCLNKVPLVIQVLV